jgi:twitching motility protein PilT
MQTFDQHLFLMYTRGVISYDDAMRYASNKDEFKLKVQGISTTSDMARDEMLHASLGRPAGSPEITRFSS